MKSRKKISKATADKWFSLIVRRRGACEHCGSVQSLQCAHVFSRLYLGTRWDEDNALCLCAGCHMFFTHRPIEWEDFVIGRMGSRQYWSMRRRAAAVTHPDYEVLLDRLLARTAELGIESRAGLP